VPSPILPGDASSSPPSSRGRLWPNSGPNVRAGFAACAAELRVSTEPWVFIDGLLFIALPYAVLYHLLLAFPSGVLQTPLERVLVGLTYVSAAVAHPVQVFFQDTARQGLPENPLLISSEREVVSTISDLRFVIGLVLLSGLALVLGRRWRATPRSQRAALARSWSRVGSSWGFWASGTGRCWQARATKSSIASRRLV
jgi:hypothetical protein